ncbi:hypothetical protein [Streptomyces sp. 891-h]|uniref:hypothetical protein n=1 Tax=Streptomyces sp. 891-h TaxID=2720714 RepID=UPI001FAA6CF4|nr:hypothetical protein [Streptomyces sp. 891-h]UNZ22319.1 hypothetical protein HC362_34705 [Streptomyces sp. 891-h]
METARIDLGPDGRGWVDGQEIEHNTLEDARVAALRRVAARARDTQRPVHVRASDPAGETALLVHPDGRIQEGEAAEELAADPDATAVPASLLPRTRAIAAALEGGRELEGSRMAHELEAEVSTEYGSRHPYTWRCRELTAHATLAAGLPGGAAELYMDAARGWLDLGRNTAYASAAQRAYACWHRVEDTAQTVWLGELLAELLRDSGGDHQETVRAVLRRVDEVQGGVLV